MSNQVVDKLNQFLSDLAVFYRKVQNYHWNVKGKDFFVVHSKLEEYYDVLFGDGGELPYLGLLGTLQFRFDHYYISKCTENKVKVQKNMILF